MESTIGDRHLRTQSLIPHQADSAMTLLRQLTSPTRLLLALLALTPIGCSDLNEALNSEPKRRTATVPGIASAADIQDVQDATGGVAPSTPAPQPTPQPTAQPTPKPSPQSKTRPAPFNPSAAPVPGKAAPKPRSTFIGKTTAEVIDYKKYRGNPFIVVVENKIQGSDPLTIAATAYVAASSRVSALNFKRQLDIIKASKGRAPSFVEFEKLQKQMKIELAKLPRYQAYAYDESTGGLLVVENKKYKIQIYREAGIPIEAGDKIYEQKLKTGTSKKRGPQ